MLKKVVLAKIIDKAKDHIVEEYQDEFIGYVQSDELKEELATKISKKPFSQASFGEYGCAYFVSVDAISLSTAGYQTNFFVWR